MSERTLATSIGKTQPYSITFEVSETFLESAAVLDRWSGPVLFRFEQRDGGGYDLVMRTEEWKL